MTNPYESPIAVGDGNSAIQAERRRLLLDRLAIVLWLAAIVPWFGAVWMVVDGVLTPTDMSNPAEWFGPGLLFLITVLLPSLSVALLAVACRRRSWRWAMVALLLQLAGVGMLTAAFLFLPGIE